ncbi:MAG: sulfite exporter TauE/SafE family protein [Saprospiraceae bacterium]|nr:sulfite exporter TauE/SafE family protein [Candidatus Brachybacter algidus]
MFEHITNKHISRVIIIIKSALVLVLAFKLWQASQSGYQLNIDREFFIFLAVGFIAEIVDGALGMAYGVICSSFLIYFGVPPALTSSAVHTSEVFTTGVSGLSHLHFKNVDKELFFKLVITGVVGSIIGAYALSKLLDGDVIKPFISAYLLFIGIRILYQQIRKIEIAARPLKHVPFLGFAGGALDAIGGGGWGPLVTSTILSRGGANAKHTIGRVNTAEFFVTFASTGIFLLLVGVASFKIILALIIGGVVAAPIGAYVVKQVRQSVLLYIVGSVLVIVSALSLWNYFW